LKTSLKTNLKTTATILASLASILLFSRAQAATHEIKMLNNGKDGVMVFEPPFLLAKKGDVVKFVPTDAAHDTASVAIPKGAKPWVGQINQSVTTTLTQEGLYLYECRTHLPMAMVGVIQVGKASNFDEVKKAADGLATKFAMNKDRLEKYLGQIKR
jgi:pseudoazurin